jgi:TetR/AcrR family transcriptional regulator, copper-responsive repressor
MSDEQPPERGRPRNFAHDKALEAATQVFWHHGFQSASLANLTDAMGIGKPSLYATFGDKEALYLQALQRYLRLHLDNRVAALNSEDDLARGLAQFLTQSAQLFTHPEHPGGCFVINGAADCGGPLTPAAVEQALKSAMRHLESQLEARLVQGQQQGQLDQRANPQALATFLGSTLAGMALTAKSGGNYATLQSIADTAMGALTPHWTVNPSARELPNA